MEKEEKAALVRSFQTHEGDTGSSEVQVALLTQRIAQLTNHLREHRHDFHTRRGLLRLVGQRRRLLRYVAAGSVDRYTTLIKQLGLRR